MTAESGKYWNKIEAIRRQMEAEEQLAVHTAEGILKEETRHQQELTVRARRIMTEIFGEIKEEHPDIKNASQSELITSEPEPVEGEVEVRLELPDYKFIELSWGKKLRGTAQDLEVLGTLTGKSNAILESQIPEKIVTADCFYLEAVVTPLEVIIVRKAVRTPTGAFVYFGDSVPLNDFVEDPTIVLPSIVRALREPQRYFREFRRGVDYDKNPQKS